jgi:hypothetical protein
LAPITPNRTEAKAFFDLRHPKDPAAPSSQVPVDTFG